MQILWCLALPSISIRRLHTCSAIVARLEMLCRLGLSDRSTELFQIDHIRTVAIRICRKCFTVTGIQGSSVILVVNRESCTGCRRIRSRTASRGITRICAVTVFTNIYWRWANRTENLPFGSVGLLWIM